MLSPLSAFHTAIVIGLEDDSNDEHPTNPARSGTAPAAGNSGEAETDDSLGVCRTYRAAVTDVSPG